LIRLLLTVGGQEIRKHDAADTNLIGYDASGSGVAATEARLSSPCGVAVDSAGNLYIADSGSDRIRKVTTSGIISTVAGNGPIGVVSTGEKSAIASTLYNPGSLSADIETRIIEVSKLIDKEPDLLVRNQFIEDMCEFVIDTGPDAISKIESIFHSSEEKAFTGFLLAQLGGERVIKILLDSFNSGHDELSNSLFIAMTSRGNSDDINHFIKQLEANQKISAVEKTNIIFALGVLHSKEAILFLEKYAITNKNKGYGYAANSCLAMDQE
jgi:hypothetical protein